MRRKHKVLLMGSARMTAKRKQWMNPAFDNLAPVRSAIREVMLD